MTDDSTSTDAAGPDQTSPESPRNRLNPSTKPMSNTSSKLFVIGAFVFIFGLGTVGSILLVDVAETALDQEAGMQDTTQTTPPDSVAAPSSGETAP
ncbi:MAG: hypothetical protein GVY25_15005 [Bacteroidetes bacterium]|nr:hypothetical protein [Bacteroidota bacterium]